MIFPFSSIIRSSATLMIIIIIFIIITFVWHVKITIKYGTMMTNHNHNYYMVFKNRIFVYTVCCMLYAASKLVLVKHTSTRVSTSSSLIVALISIIMYIYLTYQMETNNYYNGISEKLDACGRFWSR